MNDKTLTANQNHLTEHLLCVLNIKTMLLAVGVDANKPIVIVAVFDLGANRPYVNSLPDILDCETLRKAVFHLPKTVKLFSLLLNNF